MRRIPDRHTERVAHQRYWRDRRVLQELQTSAEGLRLLAADCEPQRAEHYTVAAQCAELAAKAFEDGWLK